MANRNEAERLIESFTPLPLRLALANGTPIDGERGDGSVALLWLDIVGSTGIADHFVESGPKGIEQLAALLRRHFDTLLGAVVAHGGEPMMFAGDALLAGWRCVANEPHEALLRAAACGQAVLGAPGPSLPSGASLQMHAILALGPCLSVEISAGVESLCTATGKGLADLRATALERSPGRLLLSHAARAALGEAVESEPAGQDAFALVHIRGAPSPVPLSIPALRPSDIERLRANVPLPIVNRLDSDDLEWSAELRRVTAVFVALPELEPDAPDIVAKLETVISVVSPVVREHDGYLQQLEIADKGIKLLVLFGVPPVAHPDDPARGVRLASDLRAELRTRGYRSSFGVATGLAFSGLNGNDVFRTWTVLGMPLNLAARLAGLQSGAISCDEATMRGARGAVDFAPLGRSQVRGIGPVVGVWTPRRHDHTEESVPMHGREIELAALLNVLHATAHPGESGPGRRDGLDALVLIEGEPGIGKSRLLAEFSQHASAEGVLVLSGKADRFESGVPYLGWRGVLARLLGLLSGMPVEAQREAALAALGAPLAPRAALLNAILPLDLPESAETQMLLPPQRAASRLTLLLDLLRKTAAEKPILVTIDDVQWLDDASWALVEASAREVPGLCLVVSMHPSDEETRQQTLAAAGALRMRLGELSREEQERLVLTRLRAARMSSELSELLRARARGHPFFCLELAQSLRDEGLIEVSDGLCRISSNIEAARLSLPDTVHGTVTRRIDRLDPDSQLTLKVASVSGLRFPTSLVVDVHPVVRADPARIKRHLVVHQHLDLLQTEQVEELEGYAFRHGILRDVAYSLLLYSQRQQLHRSIVTWYENTCAGDLSRYYALLAHHLESADEPDRAADYLRREAERVFGLGLARQSVDIGRRAARLLGADIPDNGPELQRQIGRELEDIAKLFSGKPEELTGLHPLVDARARQLVHLLLVIAPFAHQSGEMELFALLGCICLRLTLQYGYGPQGADVYAMYSVVFGALTGDRETAAAWSRLSLASLGTRRDASFSRCAFIYAWFHNHWMAPLSQGIALADAAAEAGFADGEEIYGCFNLAGSLVQLASAGATLAEVISVARIKRPRIAGQVLNADYHLILELQYAKALAGLTEGLLVIGDAECDEQRDVASILETNLSNQIGYYYVTRLKLHVHGGDWSGAQHWSEKAQLMLPAFGGQTAEFELVQYRGLAALAAAAFGNPEKREALIDEGWDCTERLREWETRNPDLFSHKADLLDGMLQAVLGNDAEAADRLSRSAESAARGGFLNDAALAQEFLARWRLAVGDQAAAKSAASEACRTYRAWGAMAKVALLEKVFGLSAAEVSS